jgi:signal transduction histidine kinase/CheY-like chemotaxis protein
MTKVISKSIPIKLKLMLIIMAASMAVLLASSTAFIIQDRKLMKDNMVRDLTSMALLIADRSTAALIFNDNKVSSEILTALRIKRSVEAASIYDENNNIFAYYYSSKNNKFVFPNQLQMQESGFKNNHLTIIKPVILDDNKIGSVYIHASLRELNIRWQNRLLTYALIVLFTTLFAFMLATWLQRFISRPLKHLKQTAQDIAQNRDYAIRAKQISNDEFGDLVNTFNIMLDTIHKQNSELIQANQDLEKSDDKLREANEQLEQNVKIRTEELEISNIKLIAVAEELTRAKDEAESSNLAKSQFLASMSHEIRTPINAIMGMQFLLKKTNLNLNQQNYIKKSESAANSLLSIINDILDISKIEAGKLDIESTPFETEKLLEDFNNVIGYKAQEKGLEFNIIRDPKVPYILVGDELRLGQILKNLGSNAVKFTKNGVINTEISCVKYSSDSIRLKCSVQDTGIGISPKQKNKLFKTFSQIDTSLSRNYEGSGLGLVISKKLVEMMNGEIWLESSEPGVGSTFSFTVNVGVADEKIYKTNQNKIDNNLFLSDKHLLIVDDDKKASEILGKTAESTGISYITAETMEEAIRIIEKNRIDIVLLDSKMTQIDSIDSSKSVLHNKKLDPKPKIFVVSEHSHEDDFDKVIEAGLDGLILKPVSPTTMLDTFMNVLGKSSYEKAILQHDKISLEPIRGASILIVEDNDINREFTKEILLGEALNVDEAVNGFDAIEKVKAIRYDAILMDIQMPALDGIEATKQIRKLRGKFKNEYYENLPIIALSANALKSDVERCLASGFDAYVTKPVNPELLFQVMLKHISADSFYNNYGINLQSNNKTVTTKNKKETNNNNKLEYDFSLLQGVDIEKSLKRLVNNKSLFAKLLKQFYDQHRNMLEQILELIENNNFIEAEKNCHMVKGIVANLGAESLFKALDRVDTTLKQSQNPNQEDLLNASKEFNAFVQGIEALMRSALDQSPRKQYDEIDFIHAIDIFQFMQYTLESDFHSCKQIFMKYKDQYSDMLEEDKIIELESAINQLDIAKVKKILVELTHMLKMNVLA